MPKKELIEIVDRNGIPTGEVLEKEIVHDRNLLHKEVGIFVINSKNQVLLQKRSANKRINPSKWGLCAGHVEANEDNMKAMLRELEEEIGVVSTKENVIHFDTVVKERESNSHITYEYYMFLDKDEKEFIIQEEELSEVKWVDLKHYKDMIINDDPNITLSNNIDNINMIEKLEKIINNKEEV